MLRRSPNQGRRCAKPRVPFFKRGNLVNFSKIRQLQLVIGLLATSGCDSSPCRSETVFNPDGTVTPGRYLAVASVEWQRPILVDGRTSEWESTVFIDAGAVADKQSQLKAKVGVGAGVRYRSPVGPLQLDLAYGVQSKSIRLHLSVGFTF